MPHTPAFNNIIEVRRQYYRFYEDARDSIRRRARRLRRRVERGKTKNPRVSTIERLRDSARTGLEWLVLTEVITAEAYLTDVLAYLAEHDPTIMAKSEQRASYQEIVEADSTADLAADLRRRWARNFVDDGGPSRWIERLSKMGAKYNDALAPTMEECWGIRHVIVHAAGHATHDFVRRHPNFDVKLGDRVTLVLKRVHEYNRLIAAFANATDDMIVARVAGLNREKS